MSPLPLILPKNVLEVSWKAEFQLRLGPPAPKRTSTQLKTINFHETSQVLFFYLSFQVLEIDPSLRGDELSDEVMLRRFLWAEDELSGTFWSNEDVGGHSWKENTKNYFSYELPLSVSYKNIKHN